MERLLDGSLFLMGNSWGFFLRILSRALWLGFSIPRSLCPLVKRRVRRQEIGNIRVGWTKNFPLCAAIQLSNNRLEQTKPMDTIFAIQIP
jgi:hypothetical protein